MEGDLVLGVVVEGGEASLGAGEFEHVAQHQDAGVLDLAPHLAMREILATHYPLHHAAVFWSLTAGQALHLHHHNLGGQSRRS
jgi:hypothetical protein